MKGIMIFSIIINFVLTNGQAIDFYVLMINSLQMVVYLPLLQIVNPGNVLLFFQIIRPLVAFDVMELVEKTGFKIENVINFDIEKED
jgi:hypothetical protein